jgi:nitrogen fixation NifU-like protein
MTGLSDLYQEVLLDHHRSPRNFGPLEGATGRADGYNPLCGDRVTIFARVEGDRIAGVRFVGAGCAISTASASLMTEAVKGRTRAEADALFERFHALVRGEGKGEGLGKLEALGGVAEFPARVKCATLSWHALRAALDHRPGTISTE